MDTQAIWLIALSISTPVAGVVGFALQLRQVKKSRLENMKLLLEIEALKKAAAKSEQRIVQPSTDEVLRFSSDTVMFKRRSTRDHAAAPLPENRFKGLVSNIVFIFLAALFVTYTIYDIYRVVLWLASKL